MVGLRAGHDKMRKTRRGYVYIMASGRNGTLYIGVSNNLSVRVYEHKQGTASVFTKQRGQARYEEYPIVPDTIQRETSLKRRKREWKIALIEKANPEWKGLSAGWFEAPHSHCHGRP